MTAPTIALSSGQAPVLEMPMNRSHRAFVSHYWESGQAQTQTHAIVRKLQLLLPGIKLWLDVDIVDNIRKLEDHVGDSNVFIMY